MVRFTRRLVTRFLSQLVHFRFSNRPRHVQVVRSCPIFNSTREHGSFYGHNPGSKEFVDRTRRMMAFRNDESKYVDDTKNIPVTAQRGSTTLSPYLNFDPAYIPARQPEYIFPEGAPKQRGQFELSFSQIGGVFITAGTIGGALGLHRGIKATVGQTGKPRRIQILNHVVKNGSSLANTFGLVTLMYSGMGVVLGWARGADDFVNTLAAGTATGMVYKCTAGIKRCALAGGIGFGLASIYCLWVNRDSLKELRYLHVEPA